MSEQVKRFYAPGLDCMARDNKDAIREMIPMVLATDYDALHAEAEALRAALAGMLFAFDDGVGQEWSKPLLDHARTLTPAKEYKP